MSIHAVFRVSVGDEYAEELRTLGSKINSVWPGIFESLRKKSPNPAFDGDISTRDSWAQSMEDVMSFLQALEPYHKSLRKLEAQITIDFGVWLTPSDGFQLYSLSIGSKMHEVLGQAGWGTEISVYIGSRDNHEDDVE